MIHYPILDIQSAIVHKISCIFFYKWICYFRNIMKCPKCGKQPLSLARFVLGLNSNKIKCRNCNSKLKANHLLIILYYTGLLSGSFLGIFFYIMLEVLNWDLYIALSITLGYFVLVGVPLEMFAWKKGGYNLAE